MTYREFCDTFKEQFCKETGTLESQMRFLPDGWQGDASPDDSRLIRDTNEHYGKGSSEKLRGDYILVLEQDGDFEGQSRFSVELMYKAYQEKGWNGVWSHVQYCLAFAKRHLASDLFGEAVRYESIRDRLIIYAINYPDNRDALRGKVFRRFGDIALVLYAADKDDPTFCTVVKVPDLILEKWDVNAQTAIDDALYNTVSHFSPRLYFSFNDMLHSSYETGAFMAVGSSVKLPRPNAIALLTTVQHINGATALFCPGVRERLAEIMGGSYYVVFISVHEAILHKDGTQKPEDLLEALHAVNQLASPGELLSRSIYLYDAEKHELEMILN